MNNVCIDRDEEDVNMFKKEYMDYDGDTLKIRERSTDDKMIFSCNEYYVSSVVLSKEQALDLANSIIEHYKGLVEFEELPYNEEFKVVDDNSECKRGIKIKAFDNNDVLITLGDNGNSAYSEEEVKQFGFKFYKNN